MTVERMDEGADLPSSEMSGQKDHSFAPGLSFRKILKAIINSDLRGIFQGVAWKKAELRQLPAQALVKLTQNPSLFAFALLRKSDLQVAHAHHPQAGIESVGQKSHTYTESPCQWPRQQPDQLCQQPDGKIFNSVLH